MIQNHLDDANVMGLMAKTLEVVGLILHGGHILSIILPHVFDGNLLLVISRVKSLG